MNQEIKRRSVVDFIATESAAIARFECMFVTPEAVRAATLLVYETMRRFPYGDFALPPNRDVMDAKPVVDQYARPHFNRARRDNLKVQPRRRENFEVFGVSEKRKDLIQRGWEPLF